ncbi:MAG: ABC transporter substrate-binding protein [Salinarimonas sp.]|nr:ABC transporter substrate-binding protein [Salinarimonas sp.]
MVSRKLLYGLSAIALMSATSAHAIDVKLGVLTDMSGLYADLTGQGSVWATRKAIEDFGAEEKGWNVEVVFADHQNRPDVGSTVVRQWFDTDDVDAVVDVPTSSVALAVNELTADRNKVFLVSGAATADLTGSACTPNTVHWTYDTWALANGTGRAIVETGGESWFFLTADYAFGHALERDTSAVVEEFGGQVLGTVRHPFPGTDFSSFILQAQGSGAQIIGLANAGGDTVNAVNTAAEFGIVQAGQNLAALLMFITDVHAIGLENAQGLIFTEAWYWDQNDVNREFAAEFAEANRGNKPTMIHAGVYSSVLHYLKAIEEVGSAEDGAAVVAAMKEIPTDDKLFGEGMIREDGRKIHDMYLFEVKAPDESTGDWDYYHQRAVIPADGAFRPLEDGGCEFVASAN